MKNQTLTKRLETLWDQLNLDAVMDPFPSGWKEHFIILSTDIATTLNLDATTAEKALLDAATLMKQQPDPYPDPTLLCYLLHLKQQRPHLFKQLQDNPATMPQGEEWTLNKETFPQTMAVFKALNTGPSPMRMKESLEENLELFDAFIDRFGTRCIQPFDGRSNERIYCMSGHLEDLTQAVAELAND